MPRTHKKTFQDLSFQANKAEMTFPNGYSITVLTGRGSATNTENPYELIMNPINQTISDEPIGYLDENGVSQIMKEIQSLRPC